jgi:hypothetical protein
VQSLSHRTFERKRRNHNIQFSNQAPGVFQFIPPFSPKLGLSEPTATIPPFHAESGTDPTTKLINHLSSTKSAEFTNSFLTGDGSDIKGILQDQVNQIDAK